MQGPSGVAAALEGSDDETLDPHLERIRNARDGVGGDSDEEVCIIIHNNALYFSLFFCRAKDAIAWF